MNQEKYFASNEADKVELARLEELEKSHNPNTIRHLERLGITKDWKCLEVGAGAGSIAQWLTKKVGKNGKVVATDINTRFLLPNTMSNLEIRQHDILKDFLETDYYDLVHSRALLMHLNEPEKAIHRMADALRPGGWLLVEDFDYGSVLSTDTTNPSGALFVDLERTLFDTIRKKGIVDTFFGRRELSIVEQLGFINIDNEGWTCMNRGAGPHAQFAAMTTLAASKPLVAAGIFTQEQVNKVITLFHDPSFYWQEYTAFSAWGQKPY